MAERPVIAWTPFAAAGLKVAIVGSALVAFAETAFPTYLAAQYFDTGWWPYGLVFAALGKAALIHAIVWCPILALVGIACWATWRRTPRSPEPALAAFFVLIVGTVIVPLDLELSHYGKPAITAAVCGAALVVSLLLHVLLKFIARRAAKGLRRLLTGLTVVAAIFIAVTGIVFLRSPLADPGGYRVSPAAISAIKPDDSHVLWIVLDTVRADHLGLYGHTGGASPFLDEWSEQALVFERAMSDSMWTLPAHASMFTGLTVREHGVDFAFPFLDPSFTTVAEALKGFGYRTVCFSNNLWIWKHTNLVQGFDDKHVLYHMRNIGRFSLTYLYQKIGWTPPVGWLQYDLGAAITNNYIADLLDTCADAGNPLFLFVNYFDAHLPYNVPLAHRRMFMNDKQVARSYQLRYQFGNLTAALDYRYNIEGPDFLSDGDLEVLRLLYLAGIRYLDDRVRELVNMYEERGMMDDTLVVIASDHGEHLGEHGMWAHRFLTYEELVRVVMMVREPGRTQGRRIDSPVVLSDLYPTVLNFVLGESAPQAGPTARDLLAPMPDEDSPRVVVSKYNGPSKQMLRRIGEEKTTEMRHRCTPQIAAFDGRFKLLLSDSGHRELYDVIDDPTESRDLSQTHPNEVVRLEDYVRHWRERTPPYEPPAEMIVPETDPHTIRALKSLGYLGGQE